MAKNNFEFFFQTPLKRSTLVDTHVECVEGGLVLTLLTPFVAHNVGNGAMVDAVGSAVCISLMTLCVLVALQVPGIELHPYS